VTEVDRFMGRARRRWWTTTTLRRASQGGVAGGLAGMAVVLTHGPRPLALGLVATGLLLVPVFLFQRRPDEVALAARLDRAAGLGSALTAAVEFRDRIDPWCSAQRHHAARLLAGLDPATLLPWRGIGWLVAATAVLLAVTLLPSDLRTTWDGRGEPATTVPAQVFPAPVRGGQGERAPGENNDRSSLHRPPTPAYPPEGGGSVTPTARSKSPLPSVGGGQGEGALGEDNDRSSPHRPPTPALPHEGGGSVTPTAHREPPLPAVGGGQGEAAAGTNATGDIGTAAATTPLLGAPDRALPRPGPTATLTLAGATLPGTVAAPPGAAPPTLRGLAAAASPTVSLAPPEAVPLHLRPTVARYFALLHPQTEADEP